MNLIKANQNGRSIMEMLGVLAVVGILSVGSIAGFSTAMSKHKNMKEVEKYNLFVQDFMQHKSLILKSGDAMGILYQRSGKTGNSSSWLAGER